VNSDEVLNAVLTRARQISGLPASASDDDLRRAEAHLGFRLHPLHARVLLEVADGGLVPWMYGVSDHGTRDENRGIVEMREFLGGKDGRDSPAFTVPLADLGCGAWLLVETRTGRVLGLDESGIVETEHTLERWLGDWAVGRDVVKEMFDDDLATHHIGKNPLTKRSMVFRSRGPLKGRRLSSRP
jgi:hypothetical protein